MQDTDALYAAALEVLRLNDRDSYTMPAPNLYPHQWLWDSCFTAIGLSHVNIDRAKLELRSLLRGQWHNGMVPNIIFRDDLRYRTDRDTWRSWISPNAPDHVKTSGITQPPMLAEAVVRIGKKLPATERMQWYRSVWPALVAYHEWIYADRDPHHEGLALLLHPWEAGLDNTPPWMSELHDHLLPSWVRVLKTLHLIPLIELFRRDTKTVPLDERFDTVEILALFDAQRRLRRKSYDTTRILPHSLFAIEDLSFNAILVRANTLLSEIAHDIRREIPEELAANMLKTRNALEELWDEYSSQYYSRDFITHKLLKEPSVATLLPLYAGTISQARAKQLVALLESDKAFGLAFPAPSVPLNSAYFSPKRYWQGPSWVNINWLIIDGLERYGFHEHANALRESSLEMVAVSGFAEYFNPLTGAAEGGENFSWTAALTIDLLKSNKNG